MTNSELMGIFWKHLGITTQEEWDSYCETCPVNEDGNRVLFRNQLPSKEGFGKAKDWKPVASNAELSWVPEKKRK